VSALTESEKVGKTMRYGVAGRSSLAAAVRSTGEEAALHASRIKLVTAVLAAALLGAALYLVLTEGVAALRSSEPEDVGVGEIPEFVYAPADTVPTTDAYGPVGPVALVFAVPSVREGLTGRVENPWVAISSQDGRYRALSAPHRPEPGADAVAVSADGRSLAWGFEDGVVVLDPVSDDVRELVEQVPGDPAVGEFSPDGRLLTVYAGALHVLEVRSGEVVATLDGIDEPAAHQAVWTTDGTALTYVEDGRLVTHDWRSGSRTSTPAPTIGEEATLAWSPSGEQLAAMREVRGVRFVEVFDVAEDGRLALAHTVRPSGHAQKELLGWVNDRRVAVTALRIETGTLELGYAMSTVDTSPPSQLMQLPGEGFHRPTLEVAAGPLSQGSARFEEPAWPATDVSKLVGSVVLSVFLLGLYLTRRPRKSQLRGTEP
jgi:hypothetical protein